MRRSDFTGVSAAKLYEKIQRNYCQLYTLFLTLQETLGRPAKHREQRLYPDRILSTSLLQVVFNTLSNRAGLVPAMFNVAQIQNTNFELWEADREASHSSESDRKGARLGEEPRDFLSCFLQLRTCSTGLQKLKKKKSQQQSGNTRAHATDVART